MLTRRDVITIMRDAEADINSIEGFEATAIFSPTEHCMIVSHGNDKVYLIFNNNLDLVKINGEDNYINYRLAYNIDDMVQAIKFLYFSF